MADFSQINALDPNALSGLKRLSKDNSPEAIKEASRQFEALFVQQVMKSMRDATPKGGMFDTEETRMYQSLLDQQMSMQLSARGKGFGLAKVIERQMLQGREPVSLPDGPVPLEPTIRRGFDAAVSPAAKDGSEAANPAAALPAADASSAVVPQLPGMPAGSRARAFVDKVWPQAVEASKATGIPARFLVAQAALETGWGKHELKNADGTPSYNLFNIKAGRSWNGATVNTSTTEHRNGQPTTESARFRAYGSYEESFRDYARLIGSNPRYAAVVGQTDATRFARGLQAAGYATDPMYADKLARIINGNTLRVALAAGSTPSA
ncbi:flagellar assembly peptidoglycan hydrolase FlgJ [Zoogloea sp. LCSB751]|uniref:flagellar assembly peptidoglycan hydrolase FlgJ n=1 Tax=Zoogloea sp. LCSB751 TaxID=1965277 RepID=UPI0009A5325D|nr:flagellar assembly peptidoglycan hydrolase FlgJ [Zoogloea sp. LCSB751]